MNKKKFTVPIISWICYGASILSAVTTSLAGYSFKTTLEISSVFVLVGLIYSLVQLAFKLTHKDNL